ncbi:protein phosphatase 2C 29 [Mangifera indica]|uniref:protein phosphatase 2C 29 n=1 Tax=Mangifera indica TaxID=29780 RepID=UPI001CFADFB6|nr:protein phosphatase 2C 29 [Mangifera indica]
MGSGLSYLFPCIKPVNRTERTTHQPDLIFASSEPLDETLGHSFCYVRSSNRFVSPTPSERFVSPSHSLRFSPSRSGSGQRGPLPETGFKAISGASVSANTSTPRTVLQLDNIYDDATETTFTGGYGVKSSIVNVSGFESTSSFSALPLQPMPRGASYDASERGPFFLSGPLERGALSGPLDPNTGCSDSGGHVHFSAPLGGICVKRKKKRNIFGISGMRKAFYEKKRPWVVPVLNFVSRKDCNHSHHENLDEEAADVVKNERDNDNVQWALGKAGEDRVHVVVSEEQGWLFVGIYDGFNGPDGPEFLMGNLYRAVYNELQGLFWDIEELDNEEKNANDDNTQETETETKIDPVVLSNENETKDGERAKRVTFEPGGIESRRRRLWEFLAEEDPEDGLDLSGSERFAFSVDDAISVNKESSAASRRWLLLSKLKQGLLTKHKEVGYGRKSLFPWRFGLQEKEKVGLDENKVEEKVVKSGKKRKEGPVDHELVLAAMSRALELTELAYLDMTDKVLDTNPELALMGSCLLVVLMRDEDVYVMNVGDSRAIVAQYQPEAVGCSVEMKRPGETGSSMEGIVEELAVAQDEMGSKVRTNEASAQRMKLTALQLSTDHSTSIEEEIIRIKNEHPDDTQCIVNDRVKGRLKVTRAFGAGFLKKPKLNDSLLEMFRNEYIGTAPYISCTPSLRHHRLCPRDQFLILSSDGLYQYLTNQEVVSNVENFMEKFPDGDPAQHLIEELLYHAADKAGMDLHELLDIPQGDRRKYHDDVTVMVVSLEGRIWKSSGKYI